MFDLVSAWAYEGRRSTVKAIVNEAVFFLERQDTVFI